MVSLADQRATFIYKNSHNSKQIVDLGHGTVGGCSRGIKGRFVGWDGHVEPILSIRCSQHTA